MQEPGTQPSKRGGPVHGTGTRHAAAGLGIGAVVAVLVALLISVGAFESLEMNVYDALHVGLARPGEADQDIVLVTVDQGSLEKVKSSLGYSYPWPRALFASVLEYIGRSRPRAVVFDLLFEGRDEDRMELDGAESDAALAGAIDAALARGVGVVLGFKARPADPIPGTTRTRAMIERAGMSIPPWNGLHRFARLDPLAVPLVEAGARLGFTNVIPEPDGVVRRVLLLAGVDGRTVPSLALAAARSGGLDVSLSPGELQVDGREVVTDGRGRAWIQFHGPGGVHAGRGRTYPCIPIYNVLRAAVQQASGRRPDVPAEVFADKWVVIGSTAAAGFDLKTTPFSRKGSFPGMEIQAVVLDNLLHGDFLRRLPGWVGLVALALACMLVGLLGRVTRSVLWGGLAMAAVAGGYGALSVGLFTTGVMLDPVAVEVGIFVSFAAVTFFNFFQERKSKQAIRHIFQYYLDPVVVRRLLDTPAQLRLGGEARVGTVFFSDIAGFTSIAERLTPEQLVEMMNLYLGAMTDIIIEHGGFLDKYIGDAIMAVFGAPAALPAHAQTACRCALASRARLVQLSNELEQRGLPGLQCRVGINTGPMVVGNMGSIKRMNYTAMGDAVNLASRLEGVNKEFGTGIMIGPDTRAALDESLVCREIDFIRVKGKLEPVRIYELVGDAGELSSRVREGLEHYREALDAYRRREFEQARASFEEVLVTMPDDGPSSTYVARCRAYLEHPPPSDWDGVFVMTVK